jgi:hypothetical protein
MMTFLRIFEMRHSRWLRLLTTALVVAGCETTGDTPVNPNPNPGGTPETSLQFLRSATGTALSKDSVSFWAVKGQDREVAMYYRPNAGRTDSVRFLRFRVRNESLLKRPDGTSFVNGDSVRITIRIKDFSKLITEFLPSGLTFSDARPAELRLDFRNCDQDFNRDGSVNQVDANLVPTFAIWKQEAVGQPWFKLTSAVEVDANLSEVKADVVSFTAHAIAY